MIKKSKSIILILSTLALAIAAYLLISQGNNRGESSNGQGRSPFRVETFQGQYGWAYRIYQDSVPVIEQQTLPGIPGEIGFQSEALARSTGLLVQQKIERGILPPTISPAELDSLGVKY